MHGQKRQIGHPVAKIYVLTQNLWPDFGQHPRFRPFLGWAKATPLLPLCGFKNSAVCTASARVIPSRALQLCSSKTSISYAHTATPFRLSDCDLRRFLYSKKIARYFHRI
jgi:hypothetical protein